MARLIFSFLFAFVLYSATLYSQKSLDSVTSDFLKMKMPVGTVRLRAADSIRKITGLLDSFTVLKDYSLNKYTAESFYLPNYDSLKARLDKNNWTITRLSVTNSYTIGGTTYYSIKKDSFNYLAVITPQDQQTMVSMKPLSVESSSSPFSQTNKIVASDRMISAEFGRAVAVTNNYAVVGVRLEDNDAESKNPMLDAGAIYVYERSPDNKWKQVQKIVASDRSKGANFGWSVGISGNTIVAGAIYEGFDAAGRNEAISEGAAYVFERGADGIWKQTQKLLTSAREGYNYFGTAVGVEGNIIVVSAPGHSRDSLEQQVGGIGDAGAIFIFEKRGNNWRRTYKLVASDRQNGAGVGNSVAISGNYIIAGSTGQHTDVNGGNRMDAAGAAYIWERTDDGKWGKAKKLVASDRSGWDEFGFSVAINGDNAVVGAKGVTLKKTDENNDPNSGEAYIFSCDENGEWKEVMAIIPTDRKDRDLYGNSVGVSGNYAIVGSPVGDTKNRDVGVIYIYWKNPQGKWVQSQKISAADERNFSNFGGTVAIHKGFIITGAHVEPRDAAGKNEQSNAGAAYIFMRGENQSKGKANPVTPKPAPKPPTNKTQ